MKYLLIFNQDAENGYLTSITLITECQKRLVEAALKCEVEFTVFGLAGKHSEVRATLNQDSVDIVEVPSGWTKEYPNGIDLIERIVEDAKYLEDDFPYLDKEVDGDTIAYYHAYKAFIADVSARRDD